MTVPQRLLSLDALPRVPSGRNFFADGPQVLAELFAAHGPLLLQETRAGRIVFGVGPAALRFALHTHRECFSSEQGWAPLFARLGRGLVNSDGPDWERARHALTGAFATPALCDAVAVIRGRIAAQCAGWRVGTQVDLYEEAMAISFAVAARLFVGISQEETARQLQAAFFALLHAVQDPWETAEDFERRLQPRVDEIAGVLLPRIAARRQGETRRALALDHLLAAGFSDAEILAQLNVLLAGGYETTSSLAAWLVYLLLRHPAERAWVLAECAGLPDANPLEQLLPRLDRALNETARLHAPIRVAPRVVRKACSFAGYHLPVGTRFCGALAATQRLPSLYPAPHEFRPRREVKARGPFTHVSFGAGRRTCIGMQLGRLEVKLLTRALLRNFELEPGAEEPRQVGFVAGFPVRGISVQIVGRRTS